MDFPVKSMPETSYGEFPKSNPTGMRPETSPMQMSPTPQSRSASASSTVLTMMMCEAPLPNATAAVVKARNTSMMATPPVACAAPSRRLLIRISIAGSLRSMACVIMAHKQDGGHDNSLSQVRRDAAKAFSTDDPGRREPQPQIPRRGYGNYAN